MAKIRVIALELTSQDVIDIMTTAAEGGIGYWSQIDVYKWSAWYEDGWKVKGSNLLPVMPKNLEPDYELLKLRLDPGMMEKGEANPWIKVTPRMLTHAAEKALIEYPHMVRLENDTLDYDASGADVIVQIATLGEVVYG